MCTTFVQRIRLRRNFDQIELIDARKNIDIAQYYRKKNMSLDDGMVVVLGDSEYYGADAINTLALLSSSSDLFNRMNAIIFSNTTVSRIIYPVLKVGRAFLLRMLGRRKIDD